MFEVGKIMAKLCIGMHAAILLFLVVMICLYVGIVVVIYKAKEHMPTSNKQRRMHTLVITVPCIFLNYLVCFFPFYMYPIVLSTVKYRPLEIEIASSFFPVFFVLNICIDPIIYALRIPLIRQTISDLISKITSSF